jgi:hypothetical protein
MGASSTAPTQQVSDLADLPHFSDSYMLCDPLFKFVINRRQIVIKIDMLVNSEKIWRKCHFQST